MAKMIFKNLNEINRQLLENNPYLRVVVRMENGKYTTYRDPVDIRCHELRDDLHAQIYGARMQGVEAFIHPALS